MNDGVQSMDISNLCEICQNVDFVSILTGPYSIALDTRYGRKVSDHIKNADPSCRLCRAACEILDNQGLRNDWRAEGYHWRVSRPKWVGYRRRPVGASAIVLAPIVGSYPLQGTLIIRHPMSAQYLLPDLYVHESRHPREEAHPATACLSIRVVSPFCQMEDFNWFKTLIEACVVSHTSCRGAGQVKPLSFLTQVIDCETRTLTHLKAGKEYLALSYCWGEDQGYSTATAHGSLPRNLPDTIADAIKVTLALRKRYLWVDRYCILPDQQPALQITKMNEIYQGALCVIIALDGEHSQAGLSGISRPRSTQIQVDTCAGRFVCPPPTWTSELRKSKWKSRAWCYQEAILSPRAFVFAENQMFFTCKTHIISEAHSTAAEIASVEHPFLLDAHELSTAGRKSSSQNVFHRHVNEYSSKNLTHDTDALNAFKGIISACAVYTYWGLPLDLTHEYCDVAKQHNVRSISTRTPDLCENLSFAFALAWSVASDSVCLDDIRRRKRMPTWSWISVPSSVRLYRDAVPDWPLKPRSSRKSARFWIPTKHGEWMSIPNCFPSDLQKPYILEAHGIGLGIESQWMRLHIKFTDFYDHHKLCFEVSETTGHTHTTLSSRAVSCPSDLLRTYHEKASRSHIGIFLFDDSGGIYREGRYDHHVSQWLIIDDDQPAHHRLGLVELDLCLQEGCQSPNCSSRSFIQETCVFHLE